MVPGTNIALIRMVQFSTGSAAELRAARDAAAAAGATSFVLDLRSNPGGFVDEAVDSASLFLSDKTVYIRELADKQQIPVETNDEIPATDQPLVVLIDEGTASSSEILSAALQSAGRAELVGDTTFGTGTVLLNFDLPDGSAIRLAVERWLTPDGDLIFGRGIDPTISVPMPIDQVPLDPTEVGHLDPSQVSTMPDVQLRRALELLQATVGLRRQPEADRFARSSGRRPTARCRTGPSRLRLSRSNSTSTVRSSAPRTILTVMDPAEPTVPRAS